LSESETEIAVENMIYRNFFKEVISI